MTYTFDDNIVSDLHKDACGFRPSTVFYTAWNNSNDEQKQVIWDNLVARHEEKYNEDKRIEDEAVEQFEAKVKQTIELGADSRETALRWIVDELDLSDNDKLYGGDYICYKLGLPYSYATQFDLATVRNDADIYADLDAIAYGNK